MQLSSLCSVHPRIAIYRTVITSIPGHFCFGCTWCISHPPVRDLLVVCPSVICRAVCYFRFVRNASFIRLFIIGFAVSAPIHPASNRQNDEQHQRGEHHVASGGRPQLFASRLPVTIATFLEPDLANAAFAATADSIGQLAQRCYSTSQCH